MTWLLQPPGLVPYAAASRLMHDLAARRLAGQVPDTLILLEHPPTFTAGSRSQPDHIRWSPDRFSHSGADVVEVDRGGSVTFHGPGQLVGYPIVDLGRRPDLPAYLARLEEMVIATGADMGIPLTRDPANAGVWAGRAKVCAIGIRLMRWRITLHGFSLNCSTDLSWFDAIVPCGLADRQVTSLSELAGHEVTVQDARPLVARRYEEVLGATLEPAPARERAALEVPT